MGQTARKVKRPVQAGCVRVPVIMQMEALECGAACLAMVLAYYGKWVPLEQVRADCGVSRDGSNARNMVRAARSYGLIAKGCRYEPDTLRRQGSFPCIIHWNFNHFVVLDGFKGDKALLNDPAKGSYAVSMETFDQSSRAYACCSSRARTSSRAASRSRCSPLPESAWTARARPWRSCC